MPPVTSAVVVARLDRYRDTYTDTYTTDADARAASVTAPAGSVSGFTPAR